MQRVPPLSYYYYLNLSFDNNQNIERGSSTVLFFPFLIFILITTLIF